MGITILIIAIFVFVSIFLIFRIFHTYTINNSQALIVNYFVATLLAFTIYGGELPIYKIPQQSWFIPNIALGIMFALSFLLYALSTQRVGMAITSVASKMSVVIPVFIGAYIYINESISTYEFAGLLLALASFYLIFKKDKSKNIVNEIKTKHDKLLIILPLSIFLFTGANDTLMKYIRETYFNVSTSNINSEILFIGSLFAISFISSLIFFGIPEFIKKNKIELKSIIAGIILGIFNFFSAFTMFKAMGYFDSAVFFPIFNVGIVSLSAIIGIIIFKEKLTKTNYLGLIMAIGAIIFLAISG